MLGRVEVDEDEGLDDPEPQAAPATATMTSATTLSHRMRPPCSSAVGEAVLDVGSYTSKGMRTIGRVPTRLPDSVKLLIGQTEELDLERSEFARSLVRNGPFVLGMSLLPLRAGSGEAANSSSDRDSWDPEEKVSAGVQFIQSAKAPWASRRQRRASCDRPRRKSTSRCGPQPSTSPTQISRGMLSGCGNEA